MLFEPIQRSIWIRPLWKSVSVGILLALGCLGVLVWLLTTLLAMVVISEVFFKVGDVYDFAFFEVCVVHGRCEGFRV